MLSAGVGVSVWICGRVVGQIFGCVGVGVGVCALWVGGVGLRV